MLPYSIPTLSEPKSGPRVPDSQVRKFAYFAKRRTRLLFCFLFKGSGEKLPDTFARPLLSQAVGLWGRVTQGSAFCELADVAELGAPPTSASASRQSLLLFCLYFLIVTPAWRRFGAIRSRIPLSARAFPVHPFCRVYCPMLSWVHGRPRRYVACTSTSCPCHPAPSST